MHVKSVGTYRCTYTYTHIYAHRYTETHIHTHICTQIYTNTYTYTYTYTYTASALRAPHVYTPDMTHSYVWHDIFIHVTWLIHTHIHTYKIHTHIHRLIHTCVPTLERQMSHVTWHESWNMCHTCHMSHGTRRMIHVTSPPTLSHTHTQPLPTCGVECWFIHTCDITHSYMWHDLQRRSD